MLVIAFCGLALAGCQTVAGPNKPSHALSRHTWQLAEVTPSGGQPIRLAAQMQARHQLRFGEDGKLALTLDCNRGNAGWSAGEPANGSGTLEIGAISSTRALCPPPTYGDALAANLSSARGFTLLPGGRSMTITTASQVFSFVAAK